MSGQYRTKNGWMPMPSLLVSPRNEPEASLSEHEWSEDDIRLVGGHPEPHTLRLFEPQPDGRELVMESCRYVHYWVYR